MILFRYYCNSFNIYMHFLIIILLSFYVVDKTLSQTPSYIHYNINDGLPSNLVYYAFQDRKGLLWFATNKGLVRFDNNKFTVYSTGEGLSDPEVLNMWEDSDSRLWLSCFRKKLSYFQNGKIIDVNEDKMLSKIEMKTGICNYFEEKNKKIWFSSSGQDFYSLYNGHVSSFFYPDAVFNIAMIENKLFALATTSIIRMNQDFEPEVVFRFDKDRALVNPLESLAHFEDKLLYSFKDVTFLLQLKNNKISIIDSISNLYGKVSVDKSGCFWVSSPAGGAVRFRNKKNLLSPERFLPDKKVTHVLEDRQGTLWLCTLDDGIYSLPQKSPILYGDLPSKNIVSINCDNSGQVYSGDDEGNIGIIKSGILEVKHLNSPDGYNRVLSIFPVYSAGKTDLWVVADEGLFYKSIQGFEKVNTITENPKAIIFDGKSIYFGTSARLYNFPYSSQGKVALISKVQRITSLGMDSDHTIWAGGIEGIYASSDSFISNWGDIHPLLRSRIVAIQQGGPNQLWVVTPESGLLDCSVRNGKITKVVRVNSLLKRPVENIQSIFREESGRLWMATNTGIYGLYPDTWEVVQYNRFDGLADNDVRAIVVFKDTLWAGTASGITRMVLREELANGDFPTYVTAVRYQRQKTVYEINTLDSIPNEREMLLPSDASLVEVEFTGLDYRSRGNLRYECIITDVLLPFRWWTIDNAIDWIYSGFKGTIDTTVINRPSLAFGVSWPAGRYNINVLALTTRKTRSNQSDTCNIIMRPYWYTTLWFQMIVWALILSLFYQAFQTRAQLREMAISVAQSRFMALQAQINPHFIGNAINAMQRFFYPPSPMKANIYTSTLIQILRKTLYYSEKVFLPFHEEIQYSTDYMELANLRLDKGKFYYEFLGVASIRKNMPFPALFLQPILENATIHGTAKSGITKVIVTFSQKKGRIVCAIQDNGPGIFSNLKKQSEKQEGFRRSRGLAMLKDKADTLNQLYNIDLQITAEDLSDRSAVFHGTRITLSFLAAKAIEAQNHPSLIKLSDDNFSVDSIKIQTRP